MKLLTLILFSFFAIAGNTQESDGLFGVWNFSEITMDKHNVGLKSLPENITIESTGYEEGLLTIKLRSQTEVKNYSFSKTQLTKVTSVHVYDNTEITGEDTSYSLEEVAIIFYSEEENVLTVDLTWTQKDAKRIIEGIMYGGYSFGLDGEKLHFTRTNNFQIVSEAAYQKE